MSNDALYTPTGNKTEVALLNFLYQNNIEAHVKLSNRQNESEIECVIPFNPIRKSQLTVTRVQKGDKNVRVVLKGAPEAVLNHCTHILSEDVSRPIQLSDNLRN
jgi:magnesium-transporting ATPase (P-type)